MSAVVSIDGALVPPERAVVSVHDRGFLYGDGVFETFRVYGGRPFSQQEHLARLGRSAGTMRITLPVSLETLSREVDAALAASGEPDAYVRVMVTRGVAPERALLARGELRATRVILVEALHPLPRETYARGLTAITLSWTRIADGGPAASAKLLPYVTSILALEEARSRGVDEALFVGVDGSVREATSANVFVVDDAGTLVTPSEGPGVLGGITRGHVVDLACSLGLSCAVRTVPQAALARAREVFLTSSVREIASVVRVDGKTIGSGGPGEIARTLHIALRFRAGAMGPPPWE